MSDTAATSVLTPCYVAGCCNHFGCRSSPAANAATRLAMSEYRNSAATNAIDDEQQREHVGLRTLDAHEVYHALHCPYPGTDVLDEKRRQRAQASSEEAIANGVQAEGGPTESGDRAGERGASL